MALLDELKQKDNLTREDIAALLKSIAPPGKKLKTKEKAVKELDKQNSQGHGIEVTLPSYEEF